jgi:hypothetical protein
MAKLSKLVFTLSDKKELILSNHDALELYNELHKIFGGKTVNDILGKSLKPTNAQFEYDPPPVGTISGWPLQDDYISFNGLVTASTAEDTITITSSYPDDYSWTSAPPAKKYCQCS